jgi:hypothetical protein
VRAIKNNSVEYAVITFPDELNFCSIIARQDRGKRDSGQLHRSAVYLYPDFV